MNREQRIVSERKLALLKTLLKASSRLTESNHCNGTMSIYTCWEPSLTSWRFSISFLLLDGLLLWNTLESTLLSPLLEKTNDLRNRSSGFRVIPNTFFIIDWFFETGEMLRNFYQELAEECSRGFYFESSLSKFASEYSDKLT